MVPHPCTLASLTPLSTLVTLISRISLIALITLTTLPEEWRNLGQTETPLAASVTSAPRTQPKDSLFVMFNSLGFVRFWFLTSC